MEAYVEDVHLTELVYSQVNLLPPGICTGYWCLDEQVEQGVREELIRQGRYEPDE